VLGLENSLTLSAEETAWLKPYAQEVRETFAREFAAAGERFRNGEKLWRRFDTAIEAVFEKGMGTFRAVDEAHNELCVASSILSSTKVKLVHLEYEPRLLGSPKTIDFRLTTEDGATVYVDVKTITPEAKDRWEQFEKARLGGWFPENVQVGLAEDWMGGEIWHAWFATRSRILEYTLELEDKIQQAALANEKTGSTLASFSDGFNWRQDALEDFVAFYQTRRHRADDPFSAAELKYISEKKIVLRRTIGRFAYMERKRGEIRPNRTNWNVRVPRDPF
jgi:hypothetical protein